MSFRITTSLKCAKVRLICLVVVVVVVRAPWVSLFYQLSVKLDFSSFFPSSVCSWLILTSASLSLSPL